MKKIIAFTWLIALCNITHAQAKIVQYFKKLPAEQQHGYKINFKNNQYNVVADNQCSITVDEKNGYLKIIDDGTGGGTFVLELAIFKKENKTDILAVNTYAYSGDGKEGGSIAFFDVAQNMTDVSMSVWPDFGYIEDLLTNGVTKKDIEPYASTEYTYAQLPQQGTTILFNIGFKSLDAACSEGNKKACTLQKKLQPVKLLWDKKIATFNLSN
ncbi:hypothetical protein ACFOWM_07860 [Ferruginibacter yonginensis]|uniref:Uncharacterized protein n=1 Tax=Ferruginibacter yonginensis TaxID=1310416 RepID=A0ABV8QRE8_9BACT